MKNKLIDLNNHLFAQLERLGDEDITDAALQREIHRSKAMNDVAKNIIANADVALDAERLRLEYADGRTKLPSMITHTD